MSIRIQQLPPLIANQIAAGEVVERPASVVKELLENSFDAEATHIIIEIGYGGLNQIKISDNGTGIVAEDLPLAIAAHATSKINTLDDLYAIESMGFRGEALASIASVAKLTISSKPAHQETAMMLQVSGTEINLSPCARTSGTTIDVLDLFYNAPVRKKFLKSEKIEFQAIEMVVKRFALSAPGVALTLKHNGKQILSLPSAVNEMTQLTRIERIFGSAFVKEAIAIDVTHHSMTLRGWISGTHFQRSQNDRLWVYINQRMVKDKLILQALKQTYEGILHPGRFPACLLYLTLNHAEVDVNVHPTKHEVRFQQPRFVFDFMTSQLSAALKTTQKLKEQKDEARVAPQENKSLLEIAEPYPKLAFMRESSAVSHKAFNWVSLNHQYSLVLIEQHAYVVDLLALQHDYMRKQLSTIRLPLISRPLLVPIRYSLKGVSDALKKNMQQLGIHLEESGVEEIQICSIPVLLPHLDLRSFLDAVIPLEVVDPQELIPLMIQAQVFDPRLLTLEEQMELNELLLRMHQNEQIKPGVFNRLTHETCRNIVCRT